MASKKKPKQKEEGKINFKYNLREYFNFLKKYKWSVVGLLILAVIVEGLFVVDKFLFKRIVDDGDLFLSGTLPESVLIIAAIFTGVLVFRALGKWFTETVLIRLEGNLTRDLKKKYFDHIVSLSHDFHTTHKTGSLISRLGRGSHAIEGMTDTLLYNFSPLVLQLILVSVSLAIFTLAPAIVLFFVSVIFIGFSYYFQKLQAPYKLAHVEAEDSEKGLFADIFTNIDSIKYFGKERLIKKRFEKAINNTRGKLIKNYNYYRWLASGQIFILGLGTLLLIYFPIKQFLAGQMTLGTLVFVYSIYGNVVGNLFGFVWGMRNSRTYLSMERLAMILKISLMLKN